jgi:hypothetical protein
MSNNNAPAQLKVLTCLVKYCEYGVTPLRKLVHFETGLKQNNSVVRALALLQEKGFVELKHGCWRPTQAGRDLIEIGGKP